MWIWRIFSDLERKDCFFGLGFFGIIGFSELIEKSIFKVWLNLFSSVCDQIASIHYYCKVDKSENHLDQECSTFWTSGPKICSKKAWRVKRNLQSTISWRNPPPFFDVECTLLQEYGKRTEKKLAKILTSVNKTYKMLGFTSPCFI